MKIKTQRDEESKEVNYLKIIVGNNVFRVTEVHGGGIAINKQGDETDNISVYPNVSNQITIK